MPSHLQLDLASLLARAGLVLAGVLLLVSPWRAFAHDPGLSTGQFRILPGHFEVALTLAQADVAVLTPLDTNADGQVSPSEWAGAQASLEPVSYTHLRAHETPEHL